MNAFITDAGQEIPGRLFRFLGKTSITLTLAVASTVLLVMPALAAHITWERSDPIGFEVWFSHFAHWSSNHLFWDLLVFVVLGMLVERVNRWLLPAVILLAGPAIIACTWVFEYHQEYRGLSGLDCALYAAALVIALKKQWLPKAGFFFLISLLLGKSLYEITTNQALFVSDLPEGISTVPWAHISGAIVGLIVTWMWPGLSRAD